jgi:hypothetical protein
MNDDSDVIKRLKAKRIEPTANMFDLVAYRRNLVVLDTKRLLQFLIKSKYTDDDGQPLLHIVDECAATFMVARIVPEGSAFLNVFNNIIVQVFENGLGWKWTRDVVDSILTEKLMERKKNKKSVRSFSLHDFQSAFYVIVFGHACLVLVLLCEIVSKLLKK